MMIRLKDVISDVVGKALCNQTNYLYDPSLSPKEQEILLQLFLSFIPPAQVIKDISTMKTTFSMQVIRNLRHLPFSSLLQNYLAIENGLLDLQDPLQHDVIELVTRMACQASHYQRIMLLELLFKRIKSWKSENVFIFEVILQILDQTLYIVSKDEEMLLIQLYKTSNSNEIIQKLIYAVVFPNIDEIKYVFETCLDLDPTKLRWIGNEK